MSDMRALAYLVVLGLVFYVVWRFLGRNAGPKAKLGPDGTNIREPETFVVHHHGKDQGMDIANTALKERTENLSRDLPGDTHKIKAPIPGRDVELAEDLGPEQPLRYDRGLEAPDADRGRWGLWGTCRRLPEAEQYEARFITMYPTYPALLGPLLKRRFGIPFILDYQDPWVGAWGETVIGRALGAPVILLAE